MVCRPDFLLADKSGVYLAILNVAVLAVSTIYLPGEFYLIATSKLYLQILRVYLAIIGKVVALTGTAFIILENGDERELQLGDALETGATIHAAAGAMVELSLQDGRHSVI